MNDSTENVFGTGSIGKLLLKVAPPVMLAQLIQALYNIVDSFLSANTQTMPSPPSQSFTLSSSSLSHLPLAQV